MRCRDGKAVYVELAKHRLFYNTYFQKDLIVKSNSLSVLIIVLVFQTIVFAQVVEISDPNMRKALEAALKINVGQEITKEALVGLVNLIAQNRGITNLSGLEHCTNLTRLYLGNNLLTDLNGLANVNLSKLTDLALNNNQISDISLLANLTDLTNLTVLNLANNQLTDLNGLSNASTWMDWLMLLYLS